MSTSDALHQWFESNGLLSKQLGLRFRKSLSFFLSWRDKFSFTTISTYPFHYTIGYCNLWVLHCVPTMLANKTAPASNQNAWVISFSAYNPSPKLTALRTRCVSLVHYLRSWNKYVLCVFWPSTIRPFDAVVIANPTSNIVFLNDFRNGSRSRSYR